MIRRLVLSPLAVTADACYLAGDLLTYVVRRYA